MWNPEVNVWNPLDWGQSSCLSDRGLKREVNDQPKSSQVHRQFNVGPRFVDFLVVSETRTAVYDGVFKQVPVGSVRYLNIDCPLIPVPRILETPSRTLKSLAVP